MNPVAVYFLLFTILLIGVVIGDMKAEGRDE